VVTWYKRNNKKSGGLFGSTDSIVRRQLLSVKSTSCPRTIFFVREIDVLSVEWAIFLSINSTYFNIFLTHRWGFRSFPRRPFPRTSVPRRFFSSNRFLEFFPRIFSSNFFLDFFPRIFSSNHFLENKLSEISQKFKKVSRKSSKLDFLMKL
jgi:hypothetical protein